MNSNHGEDEFVAVRVQDPRIQNEGSWNSYVDFKIFLHTNSKAFTAKTSCVRRRYSEFVWLRKKLQKNAGLVPVPELPGKSFFSFSNEDFLERRRKGLQTFLDKVVHTTVCLSDSQLHLFLQTQLPVGHIQDCVQGHTPYSVMDAILTYASSNWGLAQAQEEDSIKEPSLTVSYESMESPVPHQPCLQTKETFSPELLSCGDSDPVEVRHNDSAQHKEESSVRISQNGCHLQAVVESDCAPAEAAFFLGDDPEGPGERGQQRGCQIQTPVEVHSPMGTCFEEGSAEKEEEVTTSETRADDGLQENGERVTREAEESVNPAGTVDFKDNDAEESVSGSQEEVLEVVCSERQVLENHVNGAEFPVSDDRDSEEETDEAIPEADQQHTDQKEAGREVDMTGTKDESEGESRSLPSSNGSIVKVSDEESVCDETEDSNGFTKTSEQVSHWSEVEASCGNILDLQVNGCPVEGDGQQEDEEDLRYLTSLDLSSSVGGGDLTESGEFSVLETSRLTDLADGKCAEQETLSSLSLDAAEDVHEVQMR